MGNAFANVSHQQYDLGSGSRGGVSPTSAGYAPFFAESFSGTVGLASSNGFTSQSSGTVISDDIAGPHGETVVLKNTIAADTHGFGGTFDAGSGWPVPESGDTIWLRAYYYFPSAFCAGYGNAGDGWGNTKWIRLEWGENPFARATYQIGGLSSNSCSITGPTSQGVTFEGIGGVSNKWFPSTPNLPRDEWVALQFAMKIHPTDGFIRGWNGSTYLGEQSGINSIPNYLAGGLKNIVLGDYWNGYAYQTTSWYLQDFIITTDVPDTLDSGGRPYISPSAKAGDFT